MHSAAVQAIGRSGVIVPATSRLLVVIVGDEAGEAGTTFAGSFATFGYKPGAFGLLVNVSATRGQTVRDAARTLGIGLAEIQIEQFDDPYQVPRVIRALLDTPALGPAVRATAWVDKVMSTALLAI